MKGKMNQINQETPLRDIQYESRKTIEIVCQKQLLRRYGFLCISGVANILVFVCAASDYLRLRKIWNLVETSNPIVVYVTALTCAMLLNVSMFYFSIQYKKYLQKLCTYKEVKRVGIIAFLTFIIPYVFYALFTIATRNSAYSMRSNSGFHIGNVSNSTNTDNNAILFIALYAVALPLGTSLFSMLAGYCSSDPLQMEINIYRLKKIDTQNHMMDTKQGQKELEEPLKHIQYLQKCEIDKHKAYVENLRMVGLSMIIKSFELIAKRIDTPEAYSELITKSNEYIEKYKQTPGMSYESIDFSRNGLFRKSVDEMNVINISDRGTDSFVDSFE